MSNPSYTARLGKHMPPDRLFDWQQFHADEHPAPAVVDSRRRLRICLAGFLAAAGLVFGRMVQLQVTQGRAFCQEASRPLTRLEVLPGVRGRILASSGEILACDRQVLCLAVHYRYLEDPIDAGWLRQTARLRLSRAERGRPQRVAAAEAEVRAERAQTTRRLAEICGLSASQWTSRAKQVQSRVQRIAEQVRSAGVATGANGCKSVSPGGHVGVWRRDLRRQAVSLNGSATASSRP